MTLPVRFGAFLAERGLDADAARLGRYEAFLARLLETNETHNLTAVRDAEAAVPRHLEDSLELVAELRVLAPRTVIDLGTGGGLPGIPLAIALPEVRFTLVDAREKKIAFVDRVARELGLANVRAVAARAEDLARPGRPDREAHDVLVSRALAPTRTLVELGSPLVKTGGALVCVKGEKVEGELAEAQGALGTLGLERTSLRQTPTGRVLVLTKTRPTPPRFPRESGEAKRKPL